MSLFNLEEDPEISSSCTSLILNPQNFTECSDTKDPLSDLQKSLQTMFKQAILVTHSLQIRTYSFPYRSLSIKSTGYIRIRDSSWSKSDPYFSSHSRSSLHTLVRVIKNTDASDPYQTPRNTLYVLRTSCNVQPSPPLVSMTISNLSLL